MKRVLALSLVVLACGATAWLFWLGHEFRAGGNGAESGEEGRLPPPAVESSNPAGAPAPARTRQPLPDEAAHFGPPDPESLAPESLPLPRNDPIVIRVVERETDRPVPGAEAAWCTGGEAVSYLFSLFYSSPLGWERLLFASNRIQIADSQGEVRLPRTPWAILVGARSPGRLGVRFVNVAQAQRPFSLPLDKTCDFEIQVRDSAGTPRAGVPVLLWAAERDPMKPSGEVLWQGITAGAEGRANAHPYLFSPDSPRSVAAGLAGLHPVAGEAPLVPVDLRSPPDKPVVLILPPTGAVVVRATDKEEREIREGLVAEVALLRDGRREHPLQACFAAGEARFPYVALGRELFVGVHSPRKTRWPGIGQELPGPVRPGEEVVVRLRLGCGPDRLTGRVQDAAGAPLRHSLLQLVFATISGPEREIASPGFALTDGEGRFLAWPRWPGGSRPERRELTVTLWQETERSGRASGPAATVILPGESGTGPLDLGVIVLASAPPLLTGVVRDEEGRPIQGAHVLASEILESGEAPRQVDSFTDGEGRFRLASPGPGALRLLVRPGRGGFLPETRDLPPGGTAVAVTLRRGGRLAGTVLLDPRIRPEAIKVRIGPGFEGSRRLDPDGRFDFGPLAPGSYGVQGMLGEREVARIEEVRVEAGRSSRDPRLDPLDLRGCLDFFTLQVVDGMGRPILSPWVMEPAVSGPIRLYDGGADAEGWLRIPIPRETDRLVVGAEDCRPRPVSRIDSGSRIVLGEALQVTLTLITPYMPEQARAPLPRAEWFTVRLAPQETAAREACFWQPIVGKRSAPPGARAPWPCPLQVPLPGSYRLLWVLKLLTEQGVLWVETSPEPPVVIEVRDAPGSQAFSARLTREEVAAVLERHRQ